MVTVSLLAWDAVCAAAEVGRALIRSRARTAAKRAKTRKVLSSSGVDLDQDPPLDVEHPQIGPVSQEVFLLIRAACGPINGLHEPGAILESDAVQEQGPAAEVRAAAR